MPGWLPPDTVHPPRPDVPVLRHLTFTEIHALELGVYLGFLIVWGLSMNQAGTVFMLAVMAGRKIISHRRSKGDGTTCDHDIGFHDAIAEPQYFGFPPILIVGVYYAIQFAV